MNKLGKGIKTGRKEVFTKIFVLNKEVQLQMKPNNNHIIFKSENMNTYIFDSAMLHFKELGISRNLITLPLHWYAYLT